MHKTSLSFLVLGASAAWAAQPNFVGDQEFRALFAPNATWRSEKDFGRRVEAAGRALIGTPYVGGTLEQNPRREFPFVTLLGLDCVTLVETAIGMARIAPRRAVSGITLVREVERMRYRDGVASDYLSRLHYTSDWFAENQRRGLMTDVAAGWAEAVPTQFAVGFMSANAERYPALKENPAFVPRMRAHEERINRLTFNVVPVPKVAAIESKLQPGDVVMLVTNKKGLDTSHVGLVAVDRNGTRRLLHASSTRKQVILDVRLSDYLKGSPSTTGIMIGRPTNR